MQVRLPAFLAHSDRENMVDCGLLPIWRTRARSEGQRSSIAWQSSPPIVWNSSPRQRKYLQSGPAAAPGSLPTAPARRTGCRIFGGECRPGIHRCTATSAAVGQVRLDLGAWLHHRLVALARRCKPAAGVVPGVSIRNVRLRFTRRGRSGRGARETSGGAGNRYSHLVFN